MDGHERKMNGNDWQKTGGEQYQQLDGTFWFSTGNNIYIYMNKFSDPQVNRISF